MVWWLDRGVDGFRMDVINFISKADGLPDAPAIPGQRFVVAFESSSMDRTCMTTSPR